MNLHKRARAPSVDDDLPISVEGKAANTASVNNNEGSTWCSDLLEILQTPAADDIIRQCEDVDVDNIATDAASQFLIAQQRLRVFPFKDVSPCWHRLYTDTSVIQVIQQIQQHEQNANRQSTTNFNDLIHKLDMAMIMTGGYGREDTIAKIYSRLAKISKNDHQKHKTKRVKSKRLLSRELHSIPIVKFPVPQRLVSPSLTTFETMIHQLQEPVLLLGILQEWPAIEKWQSKEYWMRLTLGGRRLVPVEIGRTYVDESWGQQIMPFNQFLEHYIDNEGDMKGYLAQFDLFRHIPELNRDIMTPDYCYSDAPQPDTGAPVAKLRMKSGIKGTELVDDEDVHKNIWFGPAWTISQLHHDPYHNIFCQVVGKKYIRLYSAQHSDKLYPYPEDEPSLDGQHTINMSNTSKIDVGAMEVSPDEDWDERWPGLSQVPYQEIVLEAGQALYIPVGWWHYVRSCSVGISVSFWWT